MSYFSWCITTSLIFFTSDVKAHAQHGDYNPRGIRRFVIEEYEKLGATAGHWLESPQGLLFKSGPDPSGKALPGFSFNSLPASHPSLPDPGVPFGLRVRLPKEQDVKRLASLQSLVLLDDWTMTDEDLREVAKLPNLAVLNIDVSRATRDGVSQLESLNRLRWLGLGRGATDEHVQGLTALRTLKTLDLGYSKVKDLPGLGKVTSLTALNLAQARVTRSGLKEIAQLKALTSVNLSLEVNQAQYSHEELTELARLPALSALDLARTRISDEVLQAILTHKNLAHLNLELTRVTNLKGLAGLSKLTSLTLAGSEVSDAGMKEVGKLDKLTYLDLHGTAVTNAGLQELSGLIHLQTLELNWTRITADDLRALAPLRKLTTLGGMNRSGYKTLAVERDRFTDETLRVLREIRLLHALQFSQATNAARPAAAEDVAVLDLTLTATTGEGLQHLADLNKLSTVYLGSSVDDAGVKHLAKMEHLTTLDLSITQVTAAGLKDVVAMKNLAVFIPPPAAISDKSVRDVAKLTTLRYLDLARTNITDEGARALVNLRQLEHLNLTGTKVTNAGLAELRRAMPNCVILRYKSGHN